jgi:hypothetical protein
MTDPRLALATARGRYYRDPAGGPDLISVTNALSSIHKPALVPWGAGLVADEVIANPIVIARRARTERTALRKELVALPYGNSERAKKLGTRIHVRAQAAVLGTPYAYDEEVEPYAVQLARMVPAVAHRLRPRRRRDRVDRVQPAAGLRRHRRSVDMAPDRPARRRQLWLVDYKSSAKKPADTSSTTSSRSSSPRCGTPRVISSPTTRSEPAPKVHPHRAAEPPPPQPPPHRGAVRPQAVPRASSARWRPPVTCNAPAALGVPDGSPVVGPGRRPKGSLIWAPAS